MATESTPLSVSVAAEVERLRAQFNQQSNGFAEKKTQHATVPVGRFGNPVGAEVAVDLRLAFNYGVQATVVAACTGFGCHTPQHKGDRWTLNRGDDVVEALQENLTEAREWAQAHAEKCRAMPKPGVTP